MSAITGWGVGGVAETAHVWYISDNVLKVNIS